jgi:hypothetical protein
MDRSAAAAFGRVLGELFSEAQWQIVRPLAGGLSGSLVYVVDATGKIAGSQSRLDGQYVLKLDTGQPWNERTEVERHRAVQAQAGDFARDRVPALVATATDNKKSAVLYKIAGHSLTEMQTADGANLGHFKVISRTVATELLTRLNGQYARHHKRSVPELLKDWLGYRLDPSQAPRLHTFIDNHVGHLDLVAVADRVLANPLWLARSQALLDDHSGVSFVGWIHGDLHPGNILVHRSSGGFGSNPTRQGRGRAQLGQ